MTPTNEVVEAIASDVHDAWMATKRAQGVTSRLSEWGEEQMVPYSELSERAKDLDRGTVRAVIATPAFAALVRPVQSEIDQRETARVEALLQLCRWLTPAVDPLDPHDTAIPHVVVACAIQHDLIDDLMRRQEVVTTALDILADRWELLPDGERDVVLAGILDPSIEFWDSGACLGADVAWRELLGLQKRLRRETREMSPESRTYAEREYARMLRKLVRQVIGV